MSATNNNMKIHELQCVVGAGNTALDLALREEQWLILATFQFTTMDINSEK